MDKVKNSHIFVIFFAGALGLNIFVNLTTSMLQEYAGLMANPGPIVSALLWSTAMGILVALVTSYLFGTFTSATAANWSEKKTDVLEKAFYAFFITATVFMIINLFGEKKFYQARDGVAILAITVALINLILPSIILWFQRLGDTHNERINAELKAKKEPKKKTAKKPVDKEPGVSLIKWGIGIILVILLLKSCGGNSHQSPTDPTSSWSESTGIGGNQTTIGAKADPNARAGSDVRQPQH